MSVSLQSSFGKIIAYILTFSLSLYFGWLIFQPWLIDGHLNNLLSGERSPKNPPIKSQDSNYYYLLGRYYQYSPLLRDYKKARDLYVKAIFLNPVKSEYWIDLAKVQDALGNLTDAKKAIARAVELKPTGLNTYWETANFWLKKGDIKRALKNFRYIVANYSEERAKVYPLIWLATSGDLGVILKEAIPEEINARLDYLWYLAGRGQKVEAKNTWQSLSTFTLPGAARLRYINFLISWREIRQAKEEWKGLMGVEVDHLNLVWNGSFEVADTLNNGFDWKIGKARGANIEMDDNQAKKGSKSLKIDFNGKENMDFSHVSQVIPIEPEKKYVLNVSIMAENITTTNGVRIEFVGLNGCKFYESTEVITGTNPWKEFGLRAKTPKGCYLGMVRVRREKSDKFNNRIGGTVWIDSVRIEEEMSLDLGL